MSDVRILIVALGSAAVLGGCAGRRPAAEASTSVAPVATGVEPAGSSLTVDAGVSAVRLVVEQRDSISWSLETRPVGCASAEVSPERLAIGRRDQHCSTRWDIRTPPIDDIRVRVSVGDIDVSASADRAIRLHAGVGGVRLRLDGRELRHGKSPGSGDELDLGDLSTRPRLEARTGVGSVHAELHTVSSARR